MMENQKHKTHTITTHIHFQIPEKEPVISRERAINWLVNQMKMIKSEQNPFNQETALLDYRVNINQNTQAAQNTMMVVNEMEISAAERNKAADHAASILAELMDIAIENDDVTVKSIGIYREEKNDNTLKTKIG